MDPLILLAVVLVVHIWPVPAIQDPKRQGHPLLASSDHPMRNIRVRDSSPYREVISLTSQLPWLPTLAGGSLLPEIQAHQQILGPTYVVIISLMSSIITS